jgi:hypothetical protein
MALLEKKKLLANFFITWAREVILLPIFIWEDTLELTFSFTEANNNAGRF